MKKSLKSLGTLAASVSVLGAAMLFITPNPGQSTGVPTFDISTFAELVALVNSNLEILGVNEDVLDTGRDQLNQLQDTYSAMSGARGEIAGLFNGDISPRQLAFSLTSLSQTGNALNSRVSNHMTGLENTYKPLNGLDALGRSSEDTMTASYDLLSGASFTGLALAEEGFIGAGEAMARYDGYRARIGMAEDLKASIDLNSRIAIENGMMLATLLQTLSAQGQLDAAIVNESLRGREVMARQAYRPGDN